MTDTIYALSSGVPPAAVGVIRISGPNCRTVMEKVCSRMPVSRETLLTKVRDPKTGELLDEALVLWFESPSSFTGEDCCELQLHGGRAVIQSVLNMLSEQEGLRMSEPGEFTRRAFSSGKIDLSAVEGLADLISAETEEQRKFAIRNSTGELYKLCDRWRKVLIRTRAMIEAELDFSDEDDVPDSVSNKIWSEIEKLHHEIKSQLDSGKRAERIRDGLKIVILGKPNAGKSSLLNQIAQRDAAIVTHEEGTTRDLLEVHLDLDGYPATVFDTAGIRDAKGLAEIEGIRRAREQADKADLVLEVIDSSQSDHEFVLASELQSVLSWKVFNKIDLISDSVKQEFNASASRSELRKFQVSAKTGDGVGELIENITEQCRDFWKGTENTLVNRARHRELLGVVVNSLDRSISQTNLPIELRAEELRTAADQIGRISGRVDTEDLLDVIFSEFCIGK